MIKSLPKPTGLPSPEDLLAATGIGSFARGVHHAELLHPPTGPPDRGTQRGEPLAALQFARLVGAGPRLLTAPRGDGTVVIDVPGWRAPEASNAPLRTYLRSLGWEARGWGLGTNDGDPRINGRRLAEDVVATVEREGRPVALVGWSLGGVISREVARNLPDHVRRVITFGSPVIGGPTHTVTASAFGEEECRRAAEVSERLDAENPIRVPITAIYTKRDGVVSWRACIDHTSEDVQHVEVASTHFGLGFDPDVWEIVARRLAS